MAERLSWARPIAVGADALLARVRDELPILAREVPYLAQVDRLDRHVDGAHVHQRHRWFGRMIALPSVLRPFLREDDLRWTDRERWDIPKGRLSFDVELDARYRDALRIEGDASVADRRVSLHCAVAVDADALTDVPRWLRSVVASTAERFIAGTMLDGLARMFTAAERALRVG
jgi:hypothetical protein